MQLRAELYNKHGEDLESVVVPAIETPLSNSDYTELTQAISPTQESEEFGIDIYIRVLNFVCGKLMP